MYSDYKVYRKTFAGCGLASIVCLASFEAYRTYSALSNLVDTRVLEIDRKRPNYIYIKHHIYRQSLAEELERERQNSQLVNVVVQPFGKWWKTLKHSVAWRLLQIAQTGDQLDRLKAVNQLALIDHLKDWDFQHLAQLCDARTAVSLARSNADPRWFLPPRQYGVEKELRLVLADLKTLIEKLVPDRCAEYALEHTFAAQTLKEPVGGDDGVDYRLSLSLYEHDLLKQVLSALAHLTTIPENCQRIVETGGLMTLVEVEKLFKDNTDIKLMLSRIVANLSVSGELAYDFFASGWLSILSRWHRDDDMRMQVTSDLTLANLDRDDPNRFSYEANVYPLYPNGRRKRAPDADVVFVHGLLGGVFVTWRQKDLKPQAASLLEGIASYKDEKLTLQKTPQKRAPSISDTATIELIQALQEDEPLSSEWSVVFPDLPLLAEERYTSPAVLQRERLPEGHYSVPGDKWLQEPLGDESIGRSFCWPMEWLPKDFPNVRVIGLDYQSSLSLWSASGCPCEKYNGKLETRAAAFLQKLAKANIGQDRPVVWVGHSMGGLLIKSIIVQAAASEDPAIRRIAENSRAITFLGVPHRGSAIAKLKQHTSALALPSVEVCELEENSIRLLHLNKTFLKTINSFRRKPEIVSICEANPTVLTSFKFSVHVVPESSARIDEGDFYLTKDDHLNLSKPACRQSFLYQRLMSTIWCAIQSAAASAGGAEEAHSETEEAVANEKHALHTGKKPSSLLNDVYRQLRQMDKLFNFFA